MLGEFRIFSPSKCQTLPNKTIKRFAKIYKQNSSFWSFLFLFSITLHKAMVSNAVNLLGQKPLPIAIVVYHVNCFGNYGRGLLLKKNHILRCWDCLSLPNWIIVLRNEKIVWKHGPNQPFFGHILRTKRYWNPFFSTVHRNVNKPKGRAVGLFMDLLFDFL